MEVRNKDLKTRENAEQNAIRVIKECTKNNKSFVLYTSDNEDVISAKASDLPGIVGSLFVNLMEQNLEDSRDGLSKKEIISILNIADDFLKKEKNKSDDISSIDGLIEILENLRKAIDKLNK